MKVLFRLGWPALLAAVFAVLKWCKVITWTWWWVLSPLWIDAALWIAAIVTIIVVGWNYNTKN